MRWQQGDRDEDQERDSGEDRRATEDQRAQEQDGQGQKQQADETLTD